MVCAISRDREIEQKKEISLSRIAMYYKNQEENQNW